MTLEEIFLAAVEKPPADRAAYLDAACGADAGLRARVEGLLRSHEEAGSALERPLFRDAPTADLPAPEDRPGGVIGPYKLVEPIGEGGMGAVWLAQQQEPVRRLVALKLIKAGMDTRQVLARFEAERQALALMDHPNIAKVLDAGATPSGRPYFVMELVKGTPITKYCDDHRLTPADRLGLFVQVCRAVQHAHQKGVIHRDLKPSNVLVAPYDGRPVVKVIDFGVAKAAGQPLTEKTLVTGLGAVVGTPEYMSPEQAELNNQDIDTRADVYSLGVLLYELLTGTTPLTRKRVKEAALFEVLRVIREEEPPRPSTRLSTTDELPSIAAVRGVEPAKLSKLVRGELDWIVMRALEKDRSRRYETANGLAQDVERYLADEPVLACPPSAVYRLRKFARRHRGPVLAAAGVAALLVVGTAGTTTGLVRALAAEDKAVHERDEKDRALKQEAEAKRQTRRALNTMTDEVVGDLLNRQVQMTDRQREFLKTVLAYHEEFAAATADDAEGRRDRAEGYFRVGLIRHRLGQTGDAIAAYEHGIALLGPMAETSAEDRTRLALFQNNLGLVLEDAGRDRDAVTALREALANRERLVAESSNEPRSRYLLATTYRNLAGRLRDREQMDEAGRSYARALDLCRELVAEDPNEPVYREELVTVLHSRGAMLARTGRLPDAETDCREAVAVGKKLVDTFRDRPEARQQLGSSLINLANIVRDLGRPDDAETALREALTVFKRLVGEYPNRPDFLRGLALSCNNLGNLLDIRQPRDKQRDKEIESLFRDGIAVGKRLVADFPRQPEHGDMLTTCYSSLAHFLELRERVADTEAVLREAVPVQEKLVAEFPRPASRRMLGLLYDRLGILEYLKAEAAKRPTTEAEAVWRKALAVQEKLAAEFPAIPQYREDVARTLQKLALMAAPRQEWAVVADYLERAQSHQDAARTAAPAFAPYRAAQHGMLTQLSEALGWLGDHARLAAAADQLVRLEHRPAEDRFDAACWLGHCAIFADKDAKLDPAKRTELAKQYADRAAEMLRQAVAHGFRDAARVKGNLFLAPLRGREDYKQLLAELEKKKDG